MNMENAETVLHTVGYEAPENLCSRQNDNPYCTLDETSGCTYEYKNVEKYAKEDPSFCIKCKTLVEGANRGVQNADGSYTCSKGHNWNFTESYYTTCRYKYTVAEKVCPECGNTATKISEDYYINTDIGYIYQCDSNHAWFYNAYGEPQKYVKHSPQCPQIFIPIIS